MKWGTLFSNGQKVIDNIIGEFERMTEKLEQGVLLCEKRLYEVDEEKMKLEQESEILNKAINRGMGFIKNLNKLIKGE